MARDDDERSADVESTAISDGRHATAAEPPATYRGLVDTETRPDAGEAVDPSSATADGPRGGVDHGAAGAPRVSGNDVSGNDVSGNDTSGDDASGNDTSDDDTTDNDTSDNAASDNHAFGNDASGNGGGRHQRRAIDPPRSATDAQGRQASLPPGPALVCVGLGLLTKSGWVFQDINLTLRQSSVAAIVGPAGTGRTSLLLALVGRMEANTGSLTVAGHSLRDRPKSVRAVTSVARAGRLTAPEPGLTVSESVAERCLIEDENVLAGRSRFEEACRALRLEVDATTLVGRLAGEQATLLAVALACVRVSAVIILDDLDRDVSAATQQRIVDALIRLATAMGPTIIVSTTDRIPVMEADVVLDLTPMDGAAIWALDPRNAQAELLSRQFDRYPDAWAAELPVVDADLDADPAADAGPDANPDAEHEDEPQSGLGAVPDTGHDTPHSSDYDGRWSRERWETGPRGDAPDRAGPEVGAPDSTLEPGPPADAPDPNSTSGSDRSGDNVPGSTEDPR